jgi:hypothetical protein
MKTTITTLFMVFPLRISKNKLLENGFINAYIKDEMNDIQYEDCIFLLFRPEFPSRFRKFLNLEYERTKAIINDYDYPNGFVVVVYKLDSRFALDYELVKQSKYSKTSKDFQNQFPKNVEIVKDGKSIEEKTLQYRIFNRTPDLVEFWRKRNLFPMKEVQELWFGFDEAKEILTETKLKDMIWNKFQEDELGPH